jgi:trimeric autotransporter adhesin
MKKNKIAIFILLSLINVFQLNAQNTFPTSGYVGIGTTTPTTLFELKAGHANTSMRLFSDLYGQGLNGVNTSNLNLWASEPGVTWEGAGIGNNTWILNTGGVARVTSTRGGSFMRLLNNQIDISTMDNAGVVRSAILINNGTVNISNGMNVVGQALFSRDQAVQCCSGADKYTVAIAENTSVTGRRASISLHNGGLDEGRIELSNDGGFRNIKFVDNQGLNLGLNITGKVLIGNTPTPAGYKLFVEQGILTEKVKVAIKSTANWSDYVFDKNYKLPTLQSVESFINKNKHLPGIPSAKEVVAKGVDLGEMNARLLGKVEELTLYMIALKKEVEALKKQIQNK